MEPADAIEMRVLGCLVEKQRTTPDSYPLSLNALRLACNQATNREPVLQLEEPELRSALARLSNRGWARLASGQSSRAIKYRHLLDEALRLDGREISLLTVLLLRGAQTAGELNQRSERLHRFAGLEDVERALAELAERGLVEALPRRAGQKEGRWQQLLGGDAASAAGDGAPAADTAADVSPGALAGPFDRPAAPVSLGGELAGRIGAVEERLAAVEETLRLLLERTGDR